MKEDGRKKNLISRRKIIGSASLATLASAMLSSAELRAQEKQEYQFGTDPGKHEPIPDFKFDIEATEG